MKRIKDFKSLLIAAGFAVAVVPGISAAQNEPLSVASSTWVGYGLLHLAAQKGFFKDEGVDVDFQTFEDKTATAAALASHRLDGWATTADTFIFYNAEKLGIKQVLAVDLSKGGEGIVADSSIKTVADLKGKSIAAEEGTSTYFFLLNVLKSAGVKISQVDLYNMAAGDAGGAFITGRVAAAATWDPWFSKAQQRPGSHILADTGSQPGLILDTVAFRQTVLDKRPEDVTAFINGYFKAYDYWKAHTDESNKIMAASLGMKSEAFNKALTGIEFISREGNLEYIGTPLKPGKIQDVIKRGGEVYKEVGIVKEVPDSSAVVDASPLERALKP